ncbi:hypothetical protein DV736_g5520, partial [Chaetothyriales sp. CBS 134916]
MADENPIGPQPDFNIIATEFLKVPNLPAIASGQQILAELREMRAQWTRDAAAIRQDVANIRQDLVTMITASNHNNAARVQNTYVASRSEPLSPFVNPSTAAAIPEFPTTSAELGQMTGPRGWDPETGVIYREINVQID